MTLHGNRWHEFGVCTLITLICQTLAAEEKQPDAKTPSTEQSSPDNEYINGEELSKAFDQIDRVLQGVKQRARNVGTVSCLADAKIVKDIYYEGVHGTKGGRVFLDAPLGDRFDVQTKTGHVSVRGIIYIRVDYLRRESESNESGPFRGGVTWRTTNPNLYVTVMWQTRDAGAPDRLLAIVRQEFKRERIELLPQKSEWPAATQGERLARFLVPSSPLATAPALSAKKVGAPSQPSAGVARKTVFASPQEVVTTFRQSYAMKDWYQCWLCATPAAQGAALKNLLYFLAVDPEPDLKLNEKLARRLRFALPEKAGAQIDPDAAKFFQSFAHAAGDEEADNNIVREVFRKRVGDVPALLADCCEHYPMLYDVSDVEVTKIEGDKASGYSTYTPPTPGDKELEISSAGMLLAALRS